MDNYLQNPILKGDILPVDVVFHASWWYKNTEITFDDEKVIAIFKAVEELRKDYQRKLKEPGSAPGS